jgi:DNA-binding protein HU-beta
MNKQELIEAIAKESNLSKADSKKAIDAIIKAITSSLKKGDRVAIVAFGSFSVAKRSARTGRNPQTGKAINIKAKNVVKFKAGADLLKSCCNDTGYRQIKDKKGSGGTNDSGRSKPGTNDTGEKIN